MKETDTYHTGTNLAIEIHTHARVSPYCVARLELQAEQALRASEELESRHAADVGEARGVARELRGLLAAREAETAGSAREASGREKRLLDAHSRDLDELKAKFAEERRQIRDKQAREGGKEKMNGGGAYSIPPLIFPVVRACIQLVNQWMNEMNIRVGG